MSTVSPTATVLDIQVKSDLRKSPESRQMRLDLSRRAEPNTQPIELIRRCKSSGSAFNLACVSSGLDDQEICDGLGIDPGHFSKMKKGTATLHGDMVAPFCTMVGNNIYPEWQAFQIGHTLVRIQSEAEKENEALKEQVAKLTERLQWAEDIATRRMG